MSAAISVSNIGTPSDNTVSTAKIVDDAVTSDKLAHSLDVVTDLSIGGASDGVEISNGAIALKNAGTQSKIDFYCESSNAHYTRIQAAPHSSYTGNVVLTLPASDGDAGQFLKTDGSGVMSWAASGGDTVTYGTFTPTVNSGTVTAVGSWMRIGDMVTVTFKCTSFSDTSSSTQVQVVLPFTCKSGDNYSAHGPAVNNKVFGSNNEVFEITGGTALASMYYKQSSSSASIFNAPHSYINDSSSYVKSTLTYRVA